MTTLSKKMVVVWGQEDVMSAYLCHFLMDKYQWEVKTAFSQAELEKILSYGKHRYQEVTLIISGCQTNEMSTSLNLLQKYPAFKVIMVSLQNNSIEIIHKEERSITRSVDLVSAIENEL